MLHLGNLMSIPKQLVRVKYGVSPILLFLYYYRNPKILCFAHCLICRKSSDYYIIISEHMMQFYFSFTTPTKLHYFNDPIFIVLFVNT